jgi:protoporphyrinogen oxidase
LHCILHHVDASLIYILFQVEHAFTFWKTGEFVEDKNSHFSADNYGDTVKRTVGSDKRIKSVRVLNAGRYKPTIRSLSVDRHWVPIFNAVTRILASTRKKKARSKSASTRASSEMLIDETPEYILLSDED